MTTAAIELRRIDAVTVLSLVAGKANALDASVLDALARGIDTALADRPGALVITGDGASFSGGLALPSLVDLPRAQVRGLIGTFTAAMRRVLECPIPVVAAINGNAIAGGCVLALMADERLMIDRGPKGPPRIGLNEAQLGIGLPAIVIEPLRHRLPPGSLTALALEGRLVEPPEALRLGLVGEVVAADRFEARALARAAALATSAPLAYAQIKRALLRPTMEALDRTDDAETEAWLDTWFSDEGQRRLRAVVARITTR